MDVINEIIDCSNITKNDLVIEIGPGIGTLTSFLLEKAGKVIAIELDEKMLKVLNDRFSLYNNFVLINNDVLKVDGNFAIAWSDTLNFTVEKSTRSLIGSAVSSEGLVNVYRGTGRVLLAPLK